MHYLWLNKKTRLSFKDYRCFNIFIAGSTDQIKDEAVAIKGADVCKPKYSQILWWLWGTVLVRALFQIMRTWGYLNIWLTWYLKFLWIISISGRYRVYCLIGDGESAEGSIWEAMSFGSHYKLDNLVAIFDVNRLGQSEPTSLQHHMDVYKSRAEAFGSVNKLLFCKIKI